jgi:RNase P subunit RPR2
MKKKISKKDTEKEIRIFFSKIKNKTPNDIKKIKRLAMAHNLKLKNKRKKYCKFCLTPYSGKEKVRIKNKRKNIVCDNCKKEAGWKV